MGLSGFIGLLLLAYASANNATTEVPEYPTLYLIPAEENTTCDLGEEIPCGRVIDANGTILRYERGNLTTVVSGTIPSKDCPWMIRGPLGTGILVETTCYYHFHNNYSEEHRVCSRFDNDVEIGRSISIKTCGHGFYKQYYSPKNQENFSIYYESGEAFALGFSARITFLGEPVTTTTSSPDSINTTSDGAVPKISFAFVWLALVAYSLTTSA